jgi:hypothetical protein
MNYKDYIPLEGREDLYKHAMLHALASPELAGDVLRMTKHIDLMHMAKAESDMILEELVDEYRDIRGHPFKNLWNWVCLKARNMVSSFYAK